VVGGIRFRHHPAQGAIEKREALERLAQVVTGGGQKAALCQIGTIGFVARTLRVLARHDQLGLNVFAVGHVAQVASARIIALFDDTQADLHLLSNAKEGPPA
jgi:hypothetical protein